MMGTAVEVTIGGVDQVHARESAARAFAAMSLVDRDMARSNAGGALGRLNRQGRATVADIGEPLMAVIRQAVSVADESEGAFDPTVGSLTELWDFEGHAMVPEELELAESLKKVGWWRLGDPQSWDKVGFDLGGSQLDLGGIAKGYAIDRAVASLARDGILSGMVDAGGDLRVIGQRPGGGGWRIGVQDPRDPGSLIEKLEITNLAVVTSGDYERAFTRAGVTYHHILDPKTGMPARGCRSVTVIAPSAAEADACATAAFVLGPERGIAFLSGRPEVEGMIVDASGGMNWTDGALRHRL